MALAELVLRQAATGGATADLVLGAAEQAVDSAFTLAATLPAPRLSMAIAPVAQLALESELPRLVLHLQVHAVAQIRLQAALPAPLLSARLEPPTGVAIAAVLPAPILAVGLFYDVAVQRPLVGRLTSRHCGARSKPAGMRARHDDCSALDGGATSLWQRAEAMRELAGLPSGMGFGPCSSASRFVHQDARTLGSGRIRAALADAVRDRRICSRSTHAQGIRLAKAPQERWQDLLRHARARQAGLWSSARGLEHASWQTVDVAAPLRWIGVWTFRTAIPPPAGRRAMVPPTSGRCYTPGPALLFSGRAAAGTQLLLRCERGDDPTPGTEPVLVPIRRLYVVMNNVTLHRVPDGAEVPVFNLALSLDAASWTWGFDALLPAAAESLVAPGSNGGPVELLASVNGTAFRVLAESISRERVFGDASIRISGRGRNAVLAAPYAPVMNFQQPQARTARQLMDDVLTLNGIPLGWNIDWGLTDWNVPAGVFTQQGTWMEALVAIASAAGGYLIPHPWDKSIRVRHRYPVAPWEWNTVTPDFVLPVDAVARESLRWVEKPGYNRVFVSGQDVGVLGQVTRAGTAGDVLAPMVVDALITEAAAARQRGVAVLADTGQQIEVSLRLPVLAETGIIEPGAFVEYQDGSSTRLGLVRSTQIEAGMPDVWQTLGVQSHA